MPRRLGYVLLTSFLCAAGCGKDAAESVDTAGPLIVRAETARLESIRATLTVTGAVTPAPGADWTITAPEAGRIVEMPKAEGDLVNEGDLLVRFEVPSLSAELAARQSEVTVATARAQTARSAATRLAALLERGITSQRETDDAHRELQEAEAALNQAISGKAAADALAARVVIRARFAGVVAKRWHNPGDQVSATADDPVLRVIDPRTLEVVAAVPLAQLGLVHPGSAVKIFNPADASIIDGNVISTPSVGDGAAAVGDVRISIPPAMAAATPAAKPTASAPTPTPNPATLIVGMVLQLEIQSEERPNSLVIPTAAVLREGEGNLDTYVMIAGDDGRARRQSIAIGLVAKDRTQVVSGLRAGDKVILAGPEPVAEGALVTVQK